MFGVARGKVECFRGEKVGMMMVVAGYGSRGIGGEVDGQWRSKGGSIYGVILFVWEWADLCWAWKSEWAGELGI